MVEEYEWFPTNTLYVIVNTESVRAPAFTICPKSSWRASSTWGYQTWRETSAYMRNSTLGEYFRNASISFVDLMYIGMGEEVDDMKMSSVNGETIIPILEGKY